MEIKQARCTDVCFIQLVALTAYWLATRHSAPRESKAHNIGLSAAFVFAEIQDGSNMTGTDFCVNKPYCAAAVRP